ncbi:MAG TPA: GNAT family N-acetyltransferase [Bryobacteraceae bacterium]|nr:GNAT family N-acetyltransferase [Bryobacteraceae bacterium]
MPAPEVEIRRATEADLPEILSMIRALAEYENAAPGAVTATEAQLRESLFGPHPGAEALIASSGGVVAGWALFFHNFSTWRARRGMYLEDLYVKPEMRRRGIGLALLRELSRIALERGCPRLDWLVIDWNQPAIAFYKSLGAIVLDEWTTFRLGEAAMRALAKS